MSFCSGRDCVKSLRSSCRGLYPKRLTIEDCGIVAGFLSPGQLDMFPPESVFFQTLFNTTNLCTQVLSPPAYRGTSLIRNRPPQGLPYEPMHGPTVGSYGVAVPYERGTPLRFRAVKLSLVCLVLIDETCSPLSQYSVRRFSTPPTSSQV